MNPFAPKRILCAVDLGAASPRVLAWAALFGRTFGAEVSVLYVDWWEPPQYFTEGERCNVAEVVRAGNAAEEIVLAAREKDADLIVLPAEHRPFLELTTLGTTTERVMRHSSCSVLVTPREHRPAAG